MSTRTAEDATARLGPLVQFALLAGPLLSMLDSSIMNVAVAPIATELRSDVGTVGWTISGYLLALGIGLTATPYLARRFGTLPVYRAGVVGFTVASAACAAAPNIDALLAGRALQGLLAAPLVPLAQSMLLGRGDAAKGMSPMAGMMLFLGPALGPSVGGALIGSVGWRAIFLVNLPIGAAAALATARIPAALTAPRNRGARPDPLGLVLLASGLTLVLWGCSQGGTRGWTADATWVPLLCGTVALAGYARWAASAAHPALDLTLARRGSSVLVLMLCAAASVATWAAVFLLPVFIQSAQRHSAIAAGLTMLPQGLVTGLGTVLGSKALTRISVRGTVLVGFTVLAVAGLGLLLIDLRTPLYLTATLLTARSVGIALIITPLLTALTQTVPADQLDDANTLFNMWQRVAGSLGIGLVAALFAAQTRTHGPVSGLHTTGLALAGLCAVGALAALGLPAVRNKQLAG